MAAEEKTQAPVPAPRPEVVFISGDVVVADASAGLPRLIVEAHDTGTSLRLSSTTTAADGRFRMTCARVSQPVDLRVDVLAPEGSSRSHAQRLLFSSEVRIGVTGREAFHIELTPQQLHSKKRPLPATTVEAAVAAVAVGADEAAQVVVENRQGEGSTDQRARQAAPDPPR